MKHSIMVTTFFIITIISTTQAMPSRLKTITIGGSILSIGLRYNIGGDINKTKRLLRKDRDWLYNSINNGINSTCPHDACKELQRIIEQAKSTPSQQLEDKAQETLEAAKDATTGYYNRAKKIYDDWTKSKK